MLDNFYAAAAIYNMVNIATKVFCGHGICIVGGFGVKKGSISRLLAFIAILAFLPVSSYARSLDNVGTYNGHKYQVFSTNGTYDDATEYCQSLGGHLATITSQE